MSVPSSEKPELLISSAEIPKPFLAAGENYSKEKKGRSSLSTKLPTSQNQQLATTLDSQCQLRHDTDKTQSSTERQTISKLPTSKPMTVYATVDRQCSPANYAGILLQSLNENLQYSSSKRF
jgi:hypothetical protein